VLLGSEHSAPADVPEVLLLKEGFSNADREVAEALTEPIERWRRLVGARVREISLAELDGDAAQGGLRSWYETFCTLQWAEIWSSLGSWIESAHPRFGPLVEANFSLVRGLDRTTIQAAVSRREGACRRLGRFLGRGTVLCAPTAPIIAPRKGAMRVGSRATSDYFLRTLTQTSLSGIGRLPEVTLPLATVDGVPAGLSLLAAHGHDAFLLDVAAHLARAVTG
jgi:amidase